MSDTALPASAETADTVETADAVASVVWLARGAWVTMALRAGCVLGVFDLLDEPVSAGGLARRTASDLPTMTRFLRTLADLGLVHEDDGGRYANTALGATLRQDHPSRLRDLVLMQATVPNVAAWAALDEAVRTGKGVYERVNGVPSWQRLAADPQAQRTFNAAMARRASAQVSSVLTATDLGPASTVVDVGGGRGAMLAGLLAAEPGLHGILADQPVVADEAAELFASAGLDDRARAEGCDFFESVPAGADLYVLANVLHDWDDADAMRILRTVRAAMPGGARLLVVEHVLGAPGRSPHELRDVHLVDLHMLVMFGGRERSQREYDVLLAEAGFEPSRLAGTGEWNVLETRPVV